MSCLGVAESGLVRANGLATHLGTSVKEIRDKKRPVMFEQCEEKFLALGSLSPWSTTPFLDFPKYTSMAIIHSCHDLSPIIQYNLCDGNEKRFFHTSFVQIDWTEFLL